MIKNPTTIIKDKVHMSSKWLTVGVHQMFQLREAVKQYCQTGNVETSSNHYGVLTIMIDGKIAAQVNSVSTLAWRVPFHMLKL
jgi:hypothetical protein